MIINAIKVHMCLAYQFLTVIIECGQFGAVLSIICGCDWLFAGGLILEAYTAMYYYCAVFSEVAKTM